MAERTVPKEFNDANIAAARKFKSERDALVKALRAIAAFNITPSTGASVAMQMRDTAYNALNDLQARSNGAVGNAVKP